MRKRTPSPPNRETFDPGRRYPGLRGKIVHWVEHSFEEGRLYINVRFTDHTELCWQVATTLAIEQGDLSDWESGEFKQLGVFVRNERAKNM
jgi:hypothetical protein